MQILLKFIQYDYYPPILSPGFTAPTIKIESRYHAPST